MSAGTTQTPPLPKKKICLGLQGGGAYGAFTWGVLDKILEDGRLDIDGISGTSAGGMNAMALTQGLMRGGRDGARESLYQFWKSISRQGLTASSKASNIYEEKINKASVSFGSKIMHNLQTHFSPYELNPFNVNPLREIVGRFFDFEKLRRFKGHKIFLCATHVGTGKLKIFKGENMCLDAMMASACLPFIFQAVEIDGEHFWDGGFIGNPAIYPLIYECTASDILVIQLTKQRSYELPMTAQQISDRHKEISYNSCLVREMRAIHFISKLIDEGVINSPNVRRVYMHLIRSEEAFQNLDLSSTLNTNWQFLRYLFYRGRDAAENFLHGHFQHIGVRTTAHLERDFVE